MPSSRILLKVFSEQGVKMTCKGQKQINTTCQDFLDLLKRWKCRAKAVTKAKDSTSSQADAELEATALARECEAVKTRIGQLRVLRRFEKCTGRSLHV